jgi:hypothetical protein
MSIIQLLLEKWWPLDFPPFQALILSTSEQIGPASPTGLAKYAYFAINLRNKGA